MGHDLTGFMELLSTREVIEIINNTRGGHRNVFIRQEKGTRLLRAKFRRTRFFANTHHPSSSSLYSYL